MTLRVLGVIPARLASTRLPRKLLREVAGRPLICWTWEAARRAPALTDVLVATDAQEIVDVCAAHGMPAILTSRAHASGTDRVWEVAQGRAADVYVNVQGDEPLVTPGHVAALVAPFVTHPDAQVSTLKIRATEAEKPMRSVNKVVVDAAGRALYFSKFAIPFDRDGIGTPVYKHIGLYAYRRAALEAFHRLPPSQLERTEGLEQLRFLEHGIPITVVETTEPTVGIDTEDDLRVVEPLLAARRR